MSDDIEAQAEKLFGKLPGSLSDLQRTALVCIDTQFIQHPEGSLARRCLELGLNGIYDYYSEGVRKALKTIRRVQDACREANIPVIHLRVTTLTTDGREIAPISFPSGLGVVGKSSADDVDVEQLHIGEDDPDSQFLSEVAPQPGEPVIAKLAIGAFNSSPLDQILREMGIDDVICCGFVTNGCVESTVRGAADRGYRVFLVTDGVSTWSEKGHDEGLQIMGRFFARLLTAGELEMQLGHLGSGV